VCEATVSTRAPSPVGKLNRDAPRMRAQSRRRRPLKNDVGGRSQMRGNGAHVKLYFLNLLLLARVYHQVEGAPNYFINLSLNTADGLLNL
jgi:hypothetical protein